MAGPEGWGLVWAGGLESCGRAVYIDTGRTYILRFGSLSVMMGYVFSDAVFNLTKSCLQLIKAWNMVVMSLEMVRIRARSHNSELVRPCQRTTKTKSYYPVRTKSHPIVCGVSEPQEAYMTWAGSPVHVCMCHATFVLNSDECRDYSTRYLRLLFPIKTSLLFGLHGRKTIHSSQGSRQN